VSAIGVGASQFEPDMEQLLRLSTANSILVRQLLQDGLLKMARPTPGSLRPEGGPGIGIVLAGWTEVSWCSGRYFFIP
jgi:hypothetical protein